MSNQPEGLGGIVEDQKTLRGEFMVFATKMVESIGAVDGKVDQALALLQRQAERQDRSELRVDRLESEIDAHRERQLAEREADKERTERLLEKAKTEANERIAEIEKGQQAIAARVYAAAGIVGFIVVVGPMVVKILWGV